MSVADAAPRTLDRSLGDLVAEQGARARVLERLGIDYCCHGQRTLGEACAAAGLDPAAVADEIGAVVDDTGSEVTGTGPLALVEHIVATHHRFLDDELPALTALADKVRDVHGARHPELAKVAALTTELRADLEPHLREEEQVVFPAIARLVLGMVDDGVRDGIARLASEHERAGELLGELRTVSGGYVVPDDGCASYRSLYERLEALERDTFRHIHLENNVLFPAVQALLP